VKEKKRVEVFSFIVQTILLFNGDEGQSRHQREYQLFTLSENPRITEFLTQMIENVGLRYQCHDSIGQQQFQLILTLIQKDATLFFSPLGLDFLEIFGTQSDPNKEVRKLLYTYKLRDSLIPG
jgi:hypothetical protein